MGESLNIFGKTYNNVEQIIAKDTNGNDVLFSLGAGGAVNTITMNNVTLSPVDGDVDLGTVITSNPVMTGATSSTNGASGLVPQPTSGNQGKYLKADGTWATPTNTTYSDMTGASSSSAGTHGLVPAPASGKESSYLRGDATWGNPTSGCVKTSGDQTVNGAKTFTSYPAIKNSGSRYQSINYYNGAGSQIGTLIFDAGDATNVTATRFHFRQYSPKSTATTTTTGYYEAFRLPSCTAGLSAHATYDIVTTKDVDQSIAGVKTLSDTTASSSTSTGALIVKGGIGCAKYIYGSRVYNAVWNDYAECRAVDTLKAGYCVTETESGIMTKTTERLQAGCKITSDTFGACMGETKKARTPIAVAGRVLAYPYGDVSKFHLGDAVCSAPDGKIDVMTREEIKEYPERIVGTVSEIPKYDVWEAGTKENPNPVKVNGRIWIYVR